MYGTGHILVYAFDVFMQIYVSEGWTEREAAKSILQNILFGLDIDERAFQLSYFALMMKARQYNRRIFTEGIVPNVTAIEESNGFDKNLLCYFGETQQKAESLLNIFTDAKEYGSILTFEFPNEIIEDTQRKIEKIRKITQFGSIAEIADAEKLLEHFEPLLKQAIIMSQRYECVVTNPTYMVTANAD